MRPSTDSSRSSGSRSDEVADHLLDEILYTLRRYEEMTNRAVAQVSDEKLHWRPDDEANSIAILIRHLSGNLRSRFTDLLTTDGEKPWRHRDREFEQPGEGREALMQRWDEGWTTLIDAVESLRSSDAMAVVTIRGEEHTVVQALLRALTHIAYHVGQIVYLARRIVGPDEWQTLSIARGESDEYRPQGRI